MPSSMGWSDEAVLQLIEGYKSRPGLWDPDHPEYKNQTKKTAQWTSLADELQVDIDDLKKKFNSLTASFRRERSKERSEGSRYKSGWFAYGALSFLLDKFKGRDPAARTEFPDEVLIEADNIDDRLFFNLSESAYDEHDDSSSQSTSKEPVRVLAASTSGSGHGQYKTATGSGALKRPSRIQPYRMSKMIKTEPPYESADVGNAGEQISAGRCPLPVQNERTSIDIFGELVAAKLREYSDYTRIVVQQKINNVLFDADMGLCNEPEVADPLI